MTLIEVFTGPDILGVTGGGVAWAMLYQVPMRVESGDGLSTVMGGDAFPLQDNDFVGRLPEDQDQGGHQPILGGHLGADEELDDSVAEFAAPTAPGAVELSLGATSEAVQNSAAAGSVRSRSASGSSWRLPVANVRRLEALADHALQRLLPIVRAHLGVERRRRGLLVPDL